MMQREKNEGEKKVSFVLSDRISQKKEKNPGAAGLKGDKGKTSGAGK